MKKLLAILLVCLFAVSCVACGGGEDTSSDAGFTNSGTTSSKAEVSSKEEVVSSKEESSEEPVDPKDEVKFTNKFLSWNNAYYKGGVVGVNPSKNAATTLRFSKVNEAVEDYDIGIFTREYGATIETADQDFSKFAVVVFEYDHSKFGYAKKSMAAVGSADAKTAIPEDGFVVAIHEAWNDKISAIENPAEDAEKFPFGVVFYPHGIVTTGGLDATITAAATAPVLDGVVNEGEYGDVIWDINPDNVNVSYAQFEVGNYYATAKVYMTYDADNLYLAVVVDSPNHFNNLTADNAGEMWKYECIQVNVASEIAGSEYMDEYWDHASALDASWANKVRQYGFGVNDNGETLSTVWMGTNVDSSQAQAKCSRDDAAQKTVYEVAIPWSECGPAASEETGEGPIVGEAGTQFGLSLSVNSGSDTAEFKNITLRDGGGVIGLNDWNKIPVITLG